VSKCSRVNGFAIALACVAISLSAAVAIAEDAADASHPTHITLDWQPFPDLPDPLGVAGPFVGVHNDALIVAGGANPDKETYTVRFQPGEGTWTALGIEVQSNGSLPGHGLARGADRFVVTPGYFSALRIALIEGRTFTADEMRGRTAVIVNRAAAEHFWPEWLNAEWSTCLIARSRSLMPVTTVAFLPPVSASRFMCGVASSMRSAVEVPPVRITAPTFGEATRRAPPTAPEQGTNWSASRGTPCGGPPSLAFGSLRAALRAAC